MMGDNLGLAIRNGQRNSDLAIENNEHIDLPLTRSEQREFAGKVSS